MFYISRNEEEKYFKNIPSHLLEILRNKPGHFWARLEFHLLLEESMFSPKLVSEVYLDQPHPQRVYNELVWFVHFHLRKLHLHNL